MDYRMKVGFCQKCGRAIKIYPEKGEIRQDDWDRRATDSCGCMQISVHGKRVIAQGFKQMDLSDMGI